MLRLSTHFIEAFSFLILLSSVEAVASMSGVCSSPVEKKWTDFSEINPDEKCRENEGAGVDEAQDRICRGSYENIQQAAARYIRLRNENCLAINSALAGCQKPTNTQVGPAELNCSADIFRAALQGQETILVELGRASNVVEGAQRRIGRAVKNYQEDRRAIETARENAEREVAELQAAAKAEADRALAIVDPDEAEIAASEAAALQAKADQRQADITQAKGVNYNGSLIRAEAGPVTASNGNANTIMEYASRISGLSKEQEDAGATARDFRAQIEQARQQHQRDKQALEQARLKAQNATQSLATRESDGKSRTTSEVTSKISSGGGNNPVASQRAGNASEGISNSGRPAASEGTYAERAPSENTATTSERSPASGGGYSPPAMAGMPSAEDGVDASSRPAGAGISSSRSTSASASNAKNEGSSGAQNGPATYSGTAKVPAETNLRDSVRGRLADTKVDGTAGAPGAADTSGASRAPESTSGSSKGGARSVAGAHSPSSFGGSSQSESIPKEKPEEIAASLGEKIGGPSMGLAGADTDAAISDMLGDMQSLFTSPSEGLTEAERAAFLPLDSKGRPIGGRGLASVESGNDTLGADSQPLFARVSSTIVRSAKKGLVVYGLRHKL